MRAIGRVALGAAIAGLLAAALTGCAGGADPHRVAAPAASGVASASPTPSPTPSTSQGAGEAPGTTPTIVALGDSLSRGFDACSFYGDCTKVSWITGTDTTVDSIATRLAATTGQTVVVHNDATSGRSVDDLARQVDLAIAQYPTIVTVLIGANDACRATTDEMTSPETYAATIDSQLHRLSDALPTAHILVASVPNIENLLPVVGTDATAQFLWRNLGTCATALANPTSNAAADLVRRATVTGRIEAYNSALAAVCATISTCTYDQGALFAYQPTVAQVTPLDYFHPSIAGLRELAGTEWQTLAPALGLPATSDGSG